MFSPHPATVWCGALISILLFSGNTQAQGNAGGIVPDGSTATTAGYNADGRAIITPAAADRDGISLNRYTRFDVGRPGLDIDNAGVHARILVNEVTGALPSRLEGDIAILGPRANFILANPNGIVADGVRFINTGAIALSTGRVELAAWRPSPDRTQRNILLHTSQGALDIGEGGITGAFTHLELIARSIRVNGAITNEYTHAEASVRLLAGVSTVEIDSGVSPVDERTPWMRHVSGNEISDGVAVDITPLGSLRAGRIEVLVTDKGAGVRHAGQAYATLGDFALGSEGDVVVSGGVIDALGHALIQSASFRAENAGDVSSRVEARGGSLFLHAQDSVDLDASQAAGGMGVDIRTGRFSARAAYDSAGHAMPAAVSSPGGSITLDVSGGVVLEGADVIVRDDALLTVGGDIELREGAGRPGRIVATQGRLDIDADGRVVNAGGLLQGHAADVGEGAQESESTQESGEDRFAVSIRAGAGFVNRSLSAGSLGIVFGEAGNIFIDSDGDIDNRTARIIANGSLTLHSRGDVYNHIDKNPGANGEATTVDKDTVYRLGIVPVAKRKISTDFGAAPIEGQLAYLIADGDIELKARNVFSIGGEIHANAGDLHIDAERRFENRVVRTGVVEYARQCFLGCRPSARSTVQIHGGGVTASGNISLQAGEAVVNEGGAISAAGSVELVTPATYAQSIDSYLALNQNHGMPAWFGNGYARILRNDIGGSFSARGELRFSGDVIVDGGELHADGQLTVAGERRDLRPPVREPMPGDRPQGGLLSFMLD